MDDKKPDPQDPLEQLRQLWGQAGIPLPGMVAPTMDIEELDKRITDLKTVENWLRMNLNMLQATIQGLEVQRATLQTLKTMGDQAAGAAINPAVPPNPFAAMWPWNFAGIAPETPASDAPETQKKPRKNKD